jgi:hypothetical protein
MRTSVRAAATRAPPAGGASRPPDAMRAMSRDRERGAAWGPSSSIGVGAGGCGGCLRGGRRLRGGGGGGGGASGAGVRPGHGGGAGRRVGAGRRAAGGTPRGPAPPPRGHARAHASRDGRAAGGHPRAGAHAAGRAPRPARVLRGRPRRGFRAAGAPIRPGGRARRVPTPPPGPARRCTAPPRCPGATARCHCHRTPAARAGGGLTGAGGAGRGGRLGLGAEASPVLRCGGRTNFACCGSGLGGGADVGRCRSWGSHRNTWWPHSGHGLRRADGRGPAQVRHA